MNNETIIADFERECSRTGHPLRMLQGEDACRRLLTYLKDSGLLTDSCYDFED